MLKLPKKTVALDLLRRKYLSIVLKIKGIPPASCRGGEIDPNDFDERPKSKKKCVKPDYGDCSSDYGDD